MPTPKKGARLGGSPAHQRLILANLATSLFEHGAITTTEAKARMLRPYAEKLITKAKKGDVHNRRQVLRVVRDKGVVHALFEDIAPRYAERPGGYTRITKLGPRKGDNAPMAVIELVTEEYVARAGTSRSAQSAGAPTQQAAPAGNGAEATATPDEATEAATGETETVVPVEGTDEAAFEETTGGVEGKYPDSHVPLEDADKAPEGFPVKGKESSKKYHTADSQWYEGAAADVWFKSEEAAEAAGFTKAGDAE